MTISEEQIIDAFNKKFSGKIDISITRQRRIMIKVTREDLINVMNVIANDLKTQHLSTITARDAGLDLKILYHFFIQRIMVTVETSCPRDSPTIDSIIKIFPSAVLYEREIHDLLGITPKGHPDLRFLVLPDDWKEGYPLRKDWKTIGGDING
jgi:Ni,Fe-hydrogenase III component G